jgi:hydrogenase maturation protein HypF
MEKLRGIRVSVHGIVQGVGFRPFVYGLAKRLGLRGWVRNTSAGVEIEADGPADALQRFVQDLRSQAPDLARIDGIETAWREPDGFVDFEIVASDPIPGAFQPVSPDVAICDDCLRELFDPSDRRYRYPFINCTNCGPRFTIIRDMPYDRPQTTMAAFPMCPDCAAEYADPADRRFHAQPVACPACGPQVWLEPARPGKNGAGDAPAPLAGDGAIRRARALLAQGKIVALKGLGGFHLACDATNAQAVRELRRRKQRTGKPFAVMMPDLQAVERVCELSPAERELLTSRQRPIVILNVKPGAPIAAEVAPGQHTLGVMLPYTPLHYLLLERAPGFPEALVMTSGNLSEEPIVIDNNQARERLSPLADALLLHNRDILTRCDDSVMRSVHGAPYFLRRSRGYAPDGLKLPFEAPPLLATGVELKTTFCLTRERYAFLSQHIGDLENYDGLRFYEQEVTHFEGLLRVRPQALAHDLHPAIRTTAYAQHRAQEEGLALIPVQHHHAHIAAAMADNALSGDQPVIGVAFDGTGYGDDGAIWGGEFLVADYAGYERALHLSYFPLPGGEAAIRKPARTALGLLWQLGLEWMPELPPVAFLGAQERTTVRAQLERGFNAPLTSSMGRLFDAAASLAGVRQQIDYEAQAAIEFEALADPDEHGAYPFELDGQSINPLPALKALVNDVLAGTSPARVSARFHNGAALLVRDACRALRDARGLRQVALSGGVWQNTLLLERCISLLEQDGFELILHHQVPPNDGGLALGQAAVAAYRLTH